MLTYLNVRCAPVFKVPSHYRKTETNKSKKSECFHSIEASNLLAFLYLDFSRFNAPALERFCAFNKLKWVFARDYFNVFD